MSEFGSQNMVAPLRRVLMKRPGAAMANADPDVWHYAGPLSLDQLRSDHDRFVEIIKAAGAEIVFLGDEADASADAVFTHDPSLVTDEGAIILRMGKKVRRPEPECHRACFEQLGIPILGAIEEPGTVEAGDCVWLNQQTLAVGVGFRTNESGVGQLIKLLEPLSVTVLLFDLPVGNGPDSCLHLMSVISMLDEDLALVHWPLMPVRLRRLLEDQKIEPISAPADEYDVSGSISVNALALGPRQIAMVEGSPKTIDLLRQSGCDVATFPGSELCLKAEGGPTCLTRPILRRD